MSPVSLPNATALILLKTRSQPEDPYEELIASRGCSPVFIAVLEHQQVNLDQLQDAILPIDTNIDQVRYDGLIITSQRAVEALGSTIARLSGMSFHLKHTDSRLTNYTDSQRSHVLRNTKIYVVGPATRNALIKLGFHSSNILGHETGYGEALAAYIIKHYEEHFQLDRPPNLLFLVGEVRRDIIPKTLTANTPRIPITELVVYETTTRDFENELRGAIDTLDTLENKNRWMVVFSPTGTDKAVSVMKERMQKEDQVIWRVLTIGPTTRNFMVNKLGVEPDAVAESPSPEGLMKVIEDHNESDTQRSRGISQTDINGDPMIIKELNYIS